MKCQAFINIDVYVAPSDTGVATGIYSISAGNYRLLLEFNGTYQQLILTCLAGAQIVIPNVVNGDYNHIVQVFAPDGSLLNNTCYCLQVHTVTNSGTSVNPNPTIFTQPCTIQVVVRESPDTSRLYELCNGDTIPLEYPVGDVIIIPYLTGLYVQRPVTINNTPNQTIVFLSNPFALDNTANGGFQDGDLITINYAQPIE